MKAKKILVFLVSLLCLWSCKEDEVFFSPENNTFQSIQIQKFDYVTSNGVGKIYQGVYSPNGDTIYFHVTHYPDESAATSGDWKIQGSLAQGARVEPSLSGIHDFSEEKKYRILASDGITEKEIVLELLIYEVDYGELEYGFGRYNKLFENDVMELGISADADRIAINGDYLIVADGSAPFHVLEKRTGRKADVTISMPSGFTAASIFTDDTGVFHASNRASFSPSGTDKLKVYRWTDGLTENPELIADFDISSLPNSGWISRAAIKGSSRGDAQIMFEVGSADGTASSIRATTENGFISPNLEVFDKVLNSTWNSKVIPLSARDRHPFISVNMGFPAAMVYQGSSGTFQFDVDAAKTNIYNFIISGAYHFEFNGANYLLASTVSWDSEYNLLIFNLDDPTMIPSNKDSPAEFEEFNPFVESLNITDVTNTGDVTAQVSDDGQKALIYVLSPGSGIAAFELTIIGSKK